MGSLSFEIIHYKFFYYYTYRGRRFALLSKSGKIRVILLYVYFFVQMFLGGLYELYFQTLPSEVYNWCSWLVGYLLLASTIFTTPGFWDYKNKINSYFEFLLEKENAKWKIENKKEKSERRQSLLPLAKESFSNKNYQVALDCYEELSEIFPNNRTFLLKRALTLNELKYYQEALETFRELLDVASYYKTTVSDKIYKRGKKTFYSKNYLEGLEYFNQGISLFPKEARFWVRRGNALGYLERYEEAITSFEIGLQFSPNYKFALMCKIDAQRRLNALELRELKREPYAPQQRKAEIVLTEEEAILRFLTDNEGQAFTSTALINRINRDWLPEEVDRVLNYLANENKIDLTVKDNAKYYSM